MSLSHDIVWWTWLYNILSCLVRTPRIVGVADELMAQRFRIALDMYEFGERMARSGLRRRHPAATEEQIARMLREWRVARTGAPSGDAAGRPSRRFG